MSLKEIPGLFLGPDNKDVSGSQSDDEENLEDQGDHREDHFGHSHEMMVHSYPAMRTAHTQLGSGKKDEAPPSVKGVQAQHPKN